MKFAILKKHRKPIIALSLFAITLGIVWVATWAPKQWLASHWQAQVPTLPEEELLPTFRRLLSVNDTQIDFVVRALASDQERVARNSRAALAEELPRWKLLKATESSFKVARLAAALAEQAPELRGKNRDFAAEVAIKLLLWPVDRKVIEPAQLISNCEVVLRETSQIPANVTEPSARRSATLASDAAPLSLDPSPSTEVPPIAPQPLQPLSEPSSAASISDSAADPPPRSPGNRLRVSLSDGEPATTSAPRLEPVPVTPAPTETETDWTKLETREVMRLLQSQDVLQAGKAMREFRRRGFGEVHLAFVERLLSEDIGHRRQLAEMLPSVPNIDPRPWLLWLSEDESQEVRLIAVGIMATSSDPAIKKHLRQMELQETSEAVRQQIRRSLR